MSSPVSRAGSITWRSTPAAARRQPLARQARPAGRGRRVPRPAAHLSDSRGSCTRGRRRDQPLRRVGTSQARRRRTPTSPGLRRRLATCRSVQNGGSGRVRRPGRRLRSVTASGRGVSPRVVLHRHGRMWCWELVACRSSAGLTGQSAAAVACWQGSVVPIWVMGVAVPLSDFPRYPLLFGPSPVHPLERLSAHLGGASIWAKREDCNAGLAFGGNKVRKLEYLVPEALAQGADTLVSIGGVQSNHTRQVAAVAARLGLKALLVQERWVDWPDVVYDRVGNIQLSRIMGADVRLVDAGFGIGVKASWERALQEVRARGGVPYAIPAGAS